MIMTYAPIVNIRMVREGRIQYGPRSIESAQDAVEIFTQLMEDADRESVWLACLNAKNKIIAFNCVSVGHLTGSLMHPREVFKAAILANASAIIIAHNHPSGDPAPSREDATMTRRLADAGELLSIRVLDHIIIGADGAFYSFKTEGRL